ncbi:MAG: SDR family oxidoreductase [bacterium]|nr:SDR family oxidoreductase [bacterium]
MKKTILLTGGTGLLGSHLGYEFLLRGDHVIYLARSQRYRPAVERVTGVLKRLNARILEECPGSFEVWEGDVTQMHLGQTAEQLAAWRGKIDEVWHAAAVLHFRDTYEELTEAININGTVKVLNAAHALGVRRFHHISTAYVSGTAPGVVLEEHHAHDYDFRNPYERTKYDAEQEVRRKSAEYGLATTIYRPAVIVGDSRTGRSLNFTGFYNIAKIFFLIKRVLQRRIKENPELYRKVGIYATGDRVVFPLKFPCAPDSTINLVPIDYVVRTMLELAAKPESVGQTFHITNPHPPRIVDLLREGCRMIKLDGIEFVNCSFNNALHLIREEIDGYARLGLNISFCMEIREYIHYLFGEPLFDISNVRRVLRSRFEEPPAITPGLLRLLLEYANNHQWRSAIG